MTEGEISAGAVVMLNGGSPDMTVETVKEGTAWCVWFVADQPLRGKFPIATLRAVPWRGSHPVVL